MMEGFTGQFLIVFQQCAVITAPIAVVMQYLHHFQHRLRQWNGSINRFGSVHHIVQILDM